MNKICVSKRRLTKASTGTRLRRGFRVLLAIGVPSSKLASIRCAEKAGMTYKDDVSDHVGLPRHLYAIDNGS